MKHNLKINMSSVAPVKPINAQHASFTLKDVIYHKDLITNKAPQKESYVVTNSNYYNNYILPLAFKQGQLKMF